MLRNGQLVGFCLLMFYTKQQLEEHKRLEKEANKLFRADSKRRNQGISPSSVAPKRKLKKPRRVFLWKKDYQKYFN